MRYSPAILALSAAVPALADTIKITAGENNRFDPETVTAKEGDTIEFHFGPGNHSVAMGEFDSINGPCVPANEGGFFSGYFNVDSGESDKVFRVKINDTEPIVFYSTQDRECSEGMIGAINVASEDQLNEYREKASSLSKAVAPRNVFGGEVADADSSSDDDNNKDDDNNDDNNDGEGAGTSVRAGLIGVGVAALVALMV
ncbi:hypothetical protein jhhlp_003019 [Lomentospora prolificans]|uniref:Phytocyanin domain-containing protein n=1 Tax=Lomentospora prolificans TaxID=41688 RepID=A0A2N3NFQ1_9PEZI|nr:hypothetical protein jhhlp_003019 [Lomentospora prolificans]